MNRRDKVERALKRSGRDDKTAENIASKCEAILIRDADYGAMALVAEHGYVISIDHGLMLSESNVIRETLANYASPRADGPRTTRWRVAHDLHPAGVISTIESVLSRRSYKFDELAESAIVRVPLAVAESPDLPTARPALVHEAVERGYQQQFGVVVAALRESGKVSPPSLRFLQRPNAQSVNGRKPPFAIARMFIETKANVWDIRRIVLEALSPWRSHVVRASVAESTDKMKSIEVALTLPASICESFMSDGALPAFQHSNITGARQVTFGLVSPLSEMECIDIEELARSCSGAVRLQQEGSTVTAFIPSNFVGNYMADRALQERVSWLQGVLDPWGAEIQSVGELAEMDMSSPARSGKLSEQFDAGLFNAVVDEVLAIRGYRSPSAAPRDVRDGVFRMLDRRGKQYDELARAGSSAKLIAKVIQDSEWDRPTTPGNNKYESIEECNQHGQSLTDYRRSVNEMFSDLPPGPRMLLMRFSKAPRAFFDTPEGKQAVEKARELIKKEDGEDVAKKFDERLAVIQATATSESRVSEGELTKFIKRPGSYGLSQQDAVDLAELSRAFNRGDLDTADKLFSRLDTLVRDLVPDSMWRRG